MTNQEKAAQKQAQKELVVDKITTYLQTRLGVGQHFYLTIETDKKDRLTAVSAKLSGQQLGRFRLIIKSYQIYVRIHIDYEKRTWTADGSLQYEHPGGGRNGHEFPFILNGTLDQSSPSIVEVPRYYR